jgi:phosphoribosylformylglycinamidine synthase
MVKMLDQFAKKFHRLINRWVAGEKVSAEAVARHGLTPEEYQQILKAMGRAPNLLELGIFSVMWSEHCSYKSSKVFLKRFPTQAEWVIQGPGENAGGIDIGNGLAAIFKIESHNHPSFIEPYQGAATGVGGILRDIFTMGARPIALLDSLRFGPLEVQRNRWLFEGVISGIAGYGNCVGVPTVGGEVYFQEMYNRNPLVNVFCLGIAPRNRIFRAHASGVGNPVIYVGSKTGRDGIHGASLLASSEFNAESEKMRPQVQVGDPFTEKKLMEACLEVMEKDLLVGIQDMGAAGLTSSSCEMASRAGTGIEIDLSRIPLRETGMVPYEIMLSESQERMLLVCRREQEPEVRKIFEKWDLDVAVIGQVVEQPVLRIKEKGKILAEVPVRALTDGAPLYERPIKVPAYLDMVQGLALETIPQPKDFEEVLLNVLGSPTISSKQWIYKQYDHMVGTNTVLLPGAGAAVLRIKETRKALAVSLSGNSLYCLVNPYIGGGIAVAESVRNVSCTGAKALALTDCLNFASPERPETMWQFALCVDGIAEACEKLEIPVVSGNVSFYNETNGIGIYPTPIVGVVGLLEDVDRLVTPWFKDPDDLIVLLGETREELGMSEYLKTVHGRERGFPPELDWERERSVVRCCTEAIHTGIIKSAQDLSEGGLAIALAECSLLHPMMPRGAQIELENSRGIRLDALLFGESQSRILVTLHQNQLSSLKRLAADHGIPLTLLGKVGGDHFTVRLNDERLIHFPLVELEKVWRGAIPKYFEK